MLHHWALSNTLHLRDLLFCFLHSPINRAHFPQDKDSSGDWNTRDVLSIQESLQTAISRCALGLREENLLPYHTIYFLWAHGEDVMPKINALLVLPFKSYFLFHLFLKSNFIKLLFSVSTEREPCSITFLELSWSHR